MKNDPAVDFNGLIERIGDDEGLLAELVELYLEDERGLLEAIRGGLDAGDAAAVRRAAHTLKGAVGNFCAPRAQAAALAVEMAGREGRLDEAQGSLAALELELTRVRDALARRVGG